MGRPFGLWALLGSIPVGPPVAQRDGSNRQYYLVANFLEMLVNGIDKLGGAANALFGTPLISMLCAIRERNDRRIVLMLARRLTLYFCSVFLSAGLAAQTVTGSGTTNTVPVFTGSSSIGNSPIAVSGGNVGIRTTSPFAEQQSKAWSTVRL